MLEHTEAAEALNVDKRHSIENEIVNCTPALHAFARRFARSQDDINDLVQETLVKALNSIHLYQPGTALKSWLFTIMRNTFCTGYRRKLREPIGREQCIIEVAAAPSQEWSLRKQELRKALCQLSSDRRQALLLVAFGTTYEETAKICGCRIGTVKSRVNRARHDLVKVLGSQQPE
jgi:RNA polymerase sigma-70 factor (ECF subfamily)